MLSDEETSSFLERATRVEPPFKAILPDERANELAPIRKVIRVVMDRVGKAGGRPDVTGVTAQIEQLLDESVAANAYLIGSAQRKSLMDLSEVDWEAVKAMFASGRQRTAAQMLRSMVTARITNLTRLNPTRVDLYERFQAYSTSTTPAASTSAVLRGARQAEPLRDRGRGACRLGRPDRGAACCVRPPHSSGTPPHR
jgi:type I restriction enzyme R subunit